MAKDRFEAYVRVQKKVKMGADPGPAWGLLKNGRGDEVEVSHVTLVHVPDSNVVTWPYLVARQAAECCPAGYPSAP